MDDKIYLKPCPFCGGEAQKRIIEDGGLNSHCRHVEVGCPHCDFFFKEWPHLDRNAVEEVVKKWNTRA